MSEGLCNRGPRHNRTPDAGTAQTGLLQLPPAVAPGGWPTPGYDGPTQKKDASMAGLSIRCVDDGPDTRASLSDILSDLATS